MSSCEFSDIDVNDINTDPEAEEYQGALSHHDSHSDRDDMFMKDKYKYLLRTSSKDYCDDDHYSPEHHAYPYHTARGAATEEKLRANATEERRFTTDNIFKRATDMAEERARDSYHRSFTSPKSDNNTTVSPEMKEIYQELTEINGKLKKEMQVLHDREQQLREREAALERTIELEIHKRSGLKSQQNPLVQKKLEEVQELQGQLEEALKDKTQENRRLRENFDTLKAVNDSLRKELENLQDQHVKLQKQHSSLQARFINLQRKKEYEERKVQLPAQKHQVPTRDTNPGVHQKSGSKSKAKSSTCELVYELMDWVADTSLSGTPALLTAKSDTANSSQATLEKCIKVIPAAAETLRETGRRAEAATAPGAAAGAGEKLLTCLHFVYWSLLHLPPQQKSSLSSTLRRLGEDIFQAKTALGSASFETSDLDLVTSGVGQEPAGTKVKEGIYLRASDPRTRMLSCLIVLQTLSQVDRLAYVFELLRNEVKDDRGKELFLHYQATAVVLTYLKASNKVLCAAAMDVYLQLSVESSHLTPFLQSCCNLAWFHNVALVWTLPSLQPKLMEKLSIVLQKLSKLKGSKRLFESTGIVASCQDLMRGAAKDNQFLLLNIKSILFNLNISL